MRSGRLEKKKHFFPENFSGVLRLRLRQEAQRQDAQLIIQRFLSNGYVYRPDYWSYQNSFAPLSPNSPEVPQ